MKCQKDSDSKEMGKVCTNANITLGSLRRIFFLAPKM